MVQDTLKERTSSMVYGSADAAIDSRLPRVLHIGKFFPPVAGGIETYVADLLAESVRQGLTAAALVHWPNHLPEPYPLPTEARMVAATRGGGRLPKPLEAFAGESAPTPTPGTVRGLGSESAPEDPVADQMGTAVPPQLYRAVSYGQWLYAPVSPGLPWVLRRALREFRPDVLHVHVPNTSAFALLALPAARRLPWVLHWHADVDPDPRQRALRLAYRFYRPLEQALLRRARRILVTSPSYLAASNALAPWRSKCSVLPLGIPPQRLPPVAPDKSAQARHHWPMDTRLRLLTVGRLAYYKGLEVLLDALTQCPDASLVVIGDGPKRGALEAQIRNLGLGKRVLLTGHLPDAEVHALLVACDALCLPSLDRSEAFGIVLLEALHYGRPVLASDIPGSGVGWVVRTAGHGILAPPGDSGAWAQLLCRLLANPELLRAAGKRAQDGGSQAFDLAAQVCSLCGIYDEILSA